MEMEMEMPMGRVSWFIHELLLIFSRVQNNKPATMFQKQEFVLF